MTNRYKGIDLEKLIERGEADPSAIISEADISDKARREAEPEAYALTYDEAVKARRAFNIFNLLLLIHERANGDMDYGFSAKVIETLDANDAPAGDLLNIANRVFSGNWYTIRLITMGAPVENNLRQEVYGNVDGKQFQRVASTTADWRAYDPTTSVTKMREQLNLPTDTKYLYQMECETLEIIRYLFNVATDKTDITTELAPYSQMPNAIAFSFVSRFLNNRKIQEKPHSGESITLEPGNTENEIKIILETPNSVSTLTISDCLQFFDAPADKKVKRGTMDGVKRVWRYILQQLMNQTHGRKMPDPILINLQDMVDIGMYANVDNAYRGIETMIQKMGLLHISQNFQVTETDQDGKRTRSKKNKGGFLFYGSTRSGYHASVGVNTMFGFEYYKQQYTYFPSAWAYKLTGVPFSLTEYVFSMMRQRAQELRDKSKFKITLETLQPQLGLKTVDDVRNNHGRKFTTYIKDPIIKAVDEVNAAAKKDKTINGRFKIALKVPTTNDIDVWLSKGYIEISADGEYTDYLTPIAEGRQLYTTTRQETLKAEKIKRAATRRARSEANEGAPRRGRKPKQRS